MERSLACSGRSVVPPQLHRSEADYEIALPNDGRFGARFGKQALSHVAWAQPLRLEAKQFV